MKFMVFNGTTLIGTYSYAAGTPYSVLVTMKTNDKLVVSNKAYIITDWHLNATAGIYAIYVRPL